MKVSIIETSEDFYKNTVTVRVEVTNEEIKIAKQFYDNFNNSGADRPDKKNIIQEDTIENTKAMRELYAKDTRTEGEREGKNKYTDDRFES